jgi:hypothetical protein
LLVVPLAAGTRHTMPQLMRVFCAIGFLPLITSAALGRLSASPPLQELVANRSGNPLREPTGNSQVLYLFPNGSAETDKARVLCSGR